MVRQFLLITSACVALTACDTLSNIEMPSMSSLNPFSESDTNDTANTAENAPQNAQKTAPTPPAVNASSMQTELSEMEMLTGETPSSPSASTTDMPNIEDNATGEAVGENIAEIRDDIEPIFDEPLIEAEVTETPQPMAKAEASAQQTPTAPEPVTVAEPTPTPAPAPTNTIAQTGGCPKIVIVPQTRSVTYFEGDNNTLMTARAAMNDVRGGCELVENGMEVDLDIVMDGTITPNGRMDGNTNNETFITFPYFVSVIAPNGEPVDKKILATAILFRPSVDYVDHAEKITHFIPMDNGADASQYRILIGYQLNRQQLNYNQATNMMKADDNRAPADTIGAEVKSVNPLVE